MGLSIEEMESQRGQEILRLELVAMHLRHLASPWEGQDPQVQRTEVLFIWDLAPAVDPQSST